MDDDAGSRPPIQLAAMFTAGAGAVHLAAAVPHFADSALLGSGFVAVGWAQLVAAALLFRRRRDRSVRWSVVALNVAAVVTWAVSRTVGLPVGHPGPEAAGSGDVLTVALEIAAVGVLVWRSQRGPVTPGRWRRTVVLASTWALVVGGSTLAIADIATHGHHEDVEPGHVEHASGDAHDRITGPPASTPSVAAAATRAMADDIPPRSWPGADREASSNDPGPDGADTDDHGASHTPARGEGH